MCIILVSYIFQFILKNWTFKHRFWVQQPKLFGDRGNSLNEP